MLSSTTLAYAFVWACLIQYISAEGSNSYAAWSHPYGDYQDGWDSASSDVVVKSSSVWQETPSSWSTTPAVASSISFIESPTTQSTIATSLPHSQSNWNVSEQSASASKTGTALTSHASSTTGNTVTYDWKLEWMIAAPDGVARPVIGVNGQWPCPSIDVMEGDRVVVNVYNGLGNESTSLHWHGIHQRGTNHMDGPSGATQCPIAPGQSFTYDWIADQAGTYWWHSHNMGQYPDGLWGPLIVRDPNPPFHFDEELIITFSDWYNEQMPYIIHQYQSAAGAAEDGTPDPSGGALVNSGRNVSIHVKPSTTYLVRIICPAAFSGHGWVIDGHNQTTVEVDGVYTVPVVATADDKNVRIAPGQRQAFLMRTKDDTSKNYAILDFMDPNMLFLNKGQKPTETYPLNATAWLVYNTSADYPPPPVLYNLGNDNFFDDVNYVALDKEPLLEPVDRQLVIDMSMENITGISRYTLNGHTYLGAKVPTLYSTLTVNESEASNPDVYGDINPYVFKYGEVVEVVMNNLHSNLHPMHLHGHQFQVLERSLPKAGSFPGTYSNLPPTPIRRDTLMVQNEGYAVVRFRADNPGIWLFHCHIELHVEAGFSATFIEAPEKLAASDFTLPADHINACKTYPMDYVGNAAGNDYNALNLTGAPTTVPTVDWGAIYPPVEDDAHS
ncbi:conidial pigment biosynthesis oxidase Abr1/brown 1, partial [Aureobasidium melanogenum]